jgi:serine/threonine-protein kinase HipA
MGTAKYFGLTAARAARVLGEVESAVATWREEAATLGLTADEIESFEDAFEHEERLAAQRYAG